jgi:hypothetical protein
MTSAPDDFVQQLRDRLEAGAREYGDQSFVRPVSAIVTELEQELVDLPGWTYILWCQAARKLNLTRDQRALRESFLQQIHDRLVRNDRGNATSPTGGARGAMFLLEVLCIDFFEFAQQTKRRLQPIARQIEVAQAIERDTYRGRRGSIRDPRSDD